MSALQGQAQQWLSSHHVVPGSVMCDNGTNLLATLLQGRFTHMPCTQFNLVLQVPVGKWVHWRRTAFQVRFLELMEEVLPAPEDQMEPSY